MKPSVLAALAALLLFAGFCLGADKKPLTDDAIYDQVLLKLGGDPYIAGADVKIASVKQGVVTLTGRVDNDRQKDRAAKVAKKAKGVKSVVNNIEIKKSTDQ